MIPSGIFVKTQLEELLSSLPARLIACGPSRLSITFGPDPSGEPGESFLSISQWSDDLCLVEVAGSEDLTALVVRSVAEHDPMEEVLSCHYKPEAGEFSYALYREGRPLETFESRGPALETLNFTSELRRVPLQSILQASDFMIESLSHHGIEGGLESAVPEQKAILHVDLPGKKTFWQMLLGAASWK